MPHLFVDISSHGFGHLAQAAPILNALQKRLPTLQLTVRSGLPTSALQARIAGAFTHIAGRSDFGFVMHDAVDIDAEATARAYRDFHANWAERVADEAAFLSTLAPDLVLTDVAYLPLAGAARAGFASLTMCSLNWADLFAHFFGKERWAMSIHAEILAAYRTAEAFLRLMPAMEMPALPRCEAIAPVAAAGEDRRATIDAQLHLNAGDRLVIVAFGGFDTDLSAANWPPSQGLHWLVPQAWNLQRADMTAIESLALPFVDLMRSADAVLTKPGYGAFTEAACNGTPVLYLRRRDWPEQECLIDWLQCHARCREIDAASLRAGDLQIALETLWQQPKPALPTADGAIEAASRIADRLQEAKRKENPGAVTKTDKPARPAA